MEKRESLANENQRVHLANERTFLSWVRTSIAIIAFGFVIVKFSVFMTQMAVFFRQETSDTTSHQYSAILGAGLVGFGSILSLLGFFRYKRVQRQINQGKYLPSSGFDLFVTMIVFLVGILLTAYLFESL